MDGRVRMAVRGGMGAVFWGFGSGLKVAVHFDGMLEGGEEVGAWAEGWRGRYGGDRRVGAWFLGSVGVWGVEWMGGARGKRPGGSGIRGVAVEVDEFIRCEWLRD